MRVRPRSCPLIFAESEGRSSRKLAGFFCKSVGIGPSLHRLAQWLHFSYVLRALRCSNSLELRPASRPTAFRIRASNPVRSRTAAAGGPCAGNSRRRQTPPAAHSAWPPARQRRAQAIDAKRAQKRHLGRSQKGSSNNRTDRIVALLPTEENWSHRAQRLEFRAATFQSVERKIPGPLTRPPLF